MKKINLKTVLLCGLILMIATIIFYLLAFDNIFALPIRWLSLLCLLVVELLGLTKTLKVNQNIWGETISTASIIHLVAVLILSLVFVNVFPLLLKQYLLINLLLLAIVALIDILLMHFERKALESNQQYEASASVIDECFIKAQCLLQKAETCNYKSTIEEIVELLKYSNRSALYGNESEIIEKLDMLYDLIKTDDADAVENISKIIQDMLKLRNTQLKKNGSF